jgi:hypothetical protein
VPEDVNPFVYSRVIKPDDVIDREDEIERLRRHARGGHFVRLTAPRRFGKTSMLLKLLRQAEREDGWAAVLVDLYGVVSLSDLAVRVERAYARQLRGELRSRVEAFLRTLGLGLSLGTHGISVQVQRQRPPSDPLPALHALLDLPETVLRRHAGRAIVVLDEFQDILSVQGAEAILRSHIQYHGEHAAYVFSGSQPGMMAQLFTSRQRPLYGQAEPEELGPLPDAAVGAYVAERFAAGDRGADEVLPALLDTARGHPQRLMLLAHHLFDAVEPGRSADAGDWQRALERAMDRLDGELRAFWGATNVNEQRVLRAIVEFGSPYTTAGLAAYGLTKSTASDAVARLRARGELVQREFRLVDPLLERWLRDGLVEGVPA